MTNSTANPISLTWDGPVAIIMSDHPPVNALSASVRKGLVTALAEANARLDAVAVVILCAGRTFFAGADITEFGKPPVAPDFHEMLAAIEASPRPVVVAIHGTALGGGFELALSAHYRIAAATAQVGLPEVSLGLLPGCGGTQRVPRLIGAAAALDMLTSGKPVPADKALALGLVDRVVAEAELKAAAVALAREAGASGARACVRDRSDWQVRDRAEPGLVDGFMHKNAAKFRNLPAPAAIARCVVASLALPFEEGMAVETREFAALLKSPESAALRANFFAQREAAKLPGIPAVPVRPLERVGIIGAGTMGTGIGLAMLAGGLAVTFVETGQEPLDRGRALVERGIDSAVKRGKLSPDQAADCRARTRYTVDFAALGSLDLVIEAVFEDMAIKQDVFRRLDAIARPGAILASNTSFLDLNQIAAVTSRPESVIGLHFFSPANIMPLLEVVRGAQTAPEVIATAFALVRRIGKVGVLSGVCDGFIANRMMLPRGLQAETMALEGTPIAAIDRVLFDYGFAMGHFQMMDMAGLDVVTHGQSQRSLMGDLVALGRLGQKSGAGFYDYDGERRATRSELAEQTIAAFAGFAKISHMPTTDDGEILDRLLLPVVNEGARILEEGIALRASDIDVAAVLGYNWPAYRGGPMHWGESLGLDKVVARLRELEARHGAAFTPSQGLLKAAEQGAF